MSSFWYRLLLNMSRFAGSWIFFLTARIIAAGFFCIPSRTRESIRFYGFLFPDQPGWYHRLCTLYQFQNFTTIHFDRLLLAIAPERIVYSSSGLDYLKNIDPEKGAIILQSHLGNWDIAAHLLQEQGLDIKLLLYMGIKEKEQLEQQQKEQLKNAGIRIVGVGRDGGSPFDGVEGITHLRAGGVVSMTGDMLWQKEQRSVEVDFLGGTANVPAAPYIFAMLTGAPLLPFFTFRTGRNTYRFVLHEPITITDRSRTNREKSLHKAAGQYAALLEKTLREHPFEWYHFDQFVEPH
jgi:predicted LPLAT superfamily acyltransferase